MTIKYQPGKTLLLADGLSRLLEDRQNHPIQLDVRVNLVQFSLDRVKQLREQTARDPVLAPLCDILVSGWPDTERELPKVLTPYRSYRDEMSIDDGVILKGSEQVLVPAAIQQYVLTALHAGHQGETNVASERKRVCIRRHSSRHRSVCCQLLCMPTTCTFSAERAFAAKGRIAVSMEYLLVVDHYSKFPFVRAMGRSCTSKGAITYFRELFGFHRIPELLFTKNGPQFDSYAFKQFAKQWSFVHTPSLGYAQSNGFAERTVQTKVYNPESQDGRA